jgi:hypothetical protein
MLLNEMFSPIGAPKETDQDIDWGGDLKFFMDNDDTMISKYLFPTVKKHAEHQGNPNAYKLYVPALNRIKECYCEQFNIENPEEKFSQDLITELARTIAAEQEQFIENGDYNEDF